MTTLTEYRAQVLAKSGTLDFAELAQSESNAMRASSQWNVTRGPGRSGMTIQEVNARRQAVWNAMPGRAADIEAATGIHRRSLVPILQWLRRGGYAEIVPGYEWKTVEVLNLGVDVSQGVCDKGS